MSTNNQWETVTKSRKQKNFEKKVVAHKEKKKEEALLPKLEEILPSHQFRKIITGRSGNENHSPAKSNDSFKSKSSSPKNNKSSKVPKQRDVNKKTKSGATKAPTKPKSLEQAFKNLTADEFASHLEQLKIIYPGSKLGWLKEVANYLNSSLPFECDPIFSGKSVTYPSNLASPDFKQAILDFLSSQGETSLEYFFHYTLLESMCTELNKNLPVVGYKFLLQLIGQHWPQICSNKMANTAMLRDSYQNRSNIGLSILWAIGQGGYQNLVEGIKVWQNLMLPNLTMKSYSRFITEYIEKILNTAIDQRLNINQNEFFTIYNVLRAQYPGLSREYQQSLTRSSSLFLQKYIVNTNGHVNIFVNLLRDNEINGCLSSLLHNDDCFKVWKMNYKKQLVPTINLLRKLETEIFDSATSLAMSSTFHKFLRDAEILNADLNASKRRDPNVDLVIELVKIIKDPPSIDFANKIIFSDEAHFDLGGYVNNQNCRIWGTENSHTYIKKPVHPKRVIFENEQGAAVTVNGDRYQAMLNEFLFTLIEEENIGHIWFQQDGATCHTAEAILDVLNFKSRLKRFNIILQ